MTNRDYIARIDKQIPCELMVEKKLLRNYSFLAEDEDLAARLNQQEALRKAVTGGYPG